MCALAAIKGLPDTIVDRGIVVDLKRRRPGETVARFRIRRDTAPLLDLRARLTAWVRGGERLAELGDAEPEMPESIEDRQQDAWEPLIASPTPPAGTGPSWRGRPAWICAGRPTTPTTTVFNCSPTLRTYSPR